MPPVVINIRALQICAHNLNRRTTNYAVSFLKKKKRRKKADMFVQTQSWLLWHRLDNALFLIWPFLHSGS